MERLQDFVNKLNQDFSEVGKFSLVGDGVVNTDYIMLSKRFGVYELAKVHKYDGQWMVGTALHKQPYELQIAITDFFTNVDKSELISMNEKS